MYCALVATWNQETSSMTGSMGRSFKQLLQMRHCHLAALVRDHSVLNGRFRRGHTTFALGLVADMTDFQVSATRRELDARSTVTCPTCRARATAVFSTASACTASSAMLAGMNGQKRVWAVYAPLKVICCETRKLNVHCTLTCIPVD